MFAHNIFCAFFCNITDTIFYNVKINRGLKISEKFGIIRKKVVKNVIFRHNSEKSVACINDRKSIDMFFEQLFPQIPKWCRRRRCNGIPAHDISNLHMYELCVRSRKYIP